MGNLDGLFGIVAVACGLYCFYAYYMMKKTGEINTTILLSKDMNVKKCNFTFRLKARRCLALCATCIESIKNKSKNCVKVCRLKKHQLFFSVKKTA